MKKTITILLMLLAFNLNAQSLILTEDTVINQSENYLTVRTNGYNLTVNGSLNVSSFILLNKGNNADGGSITATNDIIVGTNLFFLEDNGSVKSNTGISVGQDTAGKGTIYYCTFYNSPLIGDNVSVIQDCSLSLRDFIKDIPLGEEYIIYNELGQFISKHNLKNKREIYTNNPNRWMYFPRLNYSKRMILK